jgi:ribosomal protein S21
LESGSASAVKTPAVPIRVEVREGEDAASAFRRLQELVRRQQGRPSHKRRFGYYEKPSELNRKKAKFRRRQTQAGGRLVLHVYPHEALFARSGPSNATMR